ncbi:MAG: quinone-dependent dihydroorotate dehydrogenase [Candidatus Bathyarchaeia archaeon]
MGLSLYKTVVKPALFLTPPETAHGIAKWFFKRPLIWKILSWRMRVRNDQLRVNVGNLALPNPVGLAAGFDKNCEMSEALFHIGFGYLTLGTVTLKPREGNPKPRMWRYPERSLVNSMGLPNEGVHEIAAKLSKRNPDLGPTIVSISGLSIDEFVECYREIEPLADGIELNISTPNTVGVRIFQEPDVLTKLLSAISKVKSSKKPVWVKIPPYFDNKQRENVHNLIDACVKASIDGITATNTKLIDEPRASIGTGGLSGPLILQDMLRIVADVYKHTGGKVPINACGGISSGLDAWRALEAGASSVQLLTGLIYEGPGVVSRINRDILRMLESSKLSSLSEVTGSGLR